MLRPRFENKSGNYYKYYIDKYILQIIFTLKMIETVEKFVNIETEIV